MRTEVAHWLHRRTYRASDYSAADLLEAKRRQRLHGQRRAACPGRGGDGRRDRRGRPPRPGRRACRWSTSWSSWTAGPPTGRRGRRGGRGGARRPRRRRPARARARAGQGRGAVEVAARDLRRPAGLPRLRRPWRSTRGSCVGLLGPLLTDPSIGYVKGLYDRPLATSEGLVPTGGGPGHRADRPSAARRPVAAPVRLRPAAVRASTPAGGTLLDQVPFVSHYGVELGLLIDLAELAGIDALAQVDLGTRRHSHQSRRRAGPDGRADPPDRAGPVPRRSRVPGDKLVQFVRTGTEVEAVTWDVGVLRAAAHAHRARVPRRAATSGRPGREDPDGRRARGCRCRRGATAGWRTWSRR